VKTTWAFFLVAVGLMFSQCALAEHTVELRGIVNVPGDQLAFLQIDQEPWVVKAGEHFKGGTRQNSFQIEALEVDVTNGLVKMRIEDQDYTNTLPLPNRPEAARSWIHLENADFESAIGLLGHLSERTILLHPNVKPRPISCDGAWTESSPSETELTACFSKPIGEKAAALLEDGDCFLQIVPAAMAQTTVLGAKDLKAPAEIIQSGEINFRGVDNMEAINIYGHLLGRQFKGNENGYGTLGTFPYFVTTCPLSKAQTVYAFETLLRWSGVKIVLNDDNTFSATKEPK
jgi:hypothetical protein